MIRLKPQRILDFDIENRPHIYGGGDGFTWPDITAIAWAFVGEPGEVECELQAPPPDDEASRYVMLDRFREAYDAADIVTGHNVLGHDLGYISGALVELGLPPLGTKLVSDTYYHLKRFRGVSRSQQNLADLLGISAPKIGMSQADWKEANRLTPRGLELARTRCVGDIVQHMELRAELIRLDLLKRPNVWRNT